MRLARPRPLDVRRLAAAGVLAASLAGLAGPAAPALAGGPVPGDPSTLPAGRDSVATVQPGGSFRVPGTATTVSLSRSSGRYVLQEEGSSGSARHVFTAGRDDVRMLRQTSPQGRAGRAVVVAVESGDVTDWRVFVRRGDRLVRAKPLYGWLGSGFDTSYRPFRSWLGARNGELLTRRAVSTGTQTGRADRYRVVRWRVSAAEVPHLVPTVLGTWCFDNTTGEDRAVRCR